jgi:5-methylcytosine-specific restriction endonuclease McrA
VVDHIQSIAERPDLRMMWSNLRSGCKRCHDAHTARETAGGHAGIRVHTNAPRYTLG